VRLVVARLDAPFGPPLAESAKTAVTLTLDAGAEDAAVTAQEGREGMRRGRILRLLAEAVEQGGVLTQEDLAQVLRVDVRTIRRDIQQLKAEGHTIDTRGPVKGVGRGQTHKVKIIALWLDRQGYEKIARWVHHSPQAIKRYVTTFLRMVLLHQQGRTVSEIAFLTTTSERLVQDYLALYTAAQAAPTQRAKLDEELARVRAWQGPAGATAEKGGPTP
jgi:predicted ArsR family transcriptional regulator